MTQSYFVNQAWNLLFSFPVPVEWFTLWVDMPFMLIISDIRQGIFYVGLLSFWLIFAGEHVMVLNHWKCVFYCFSPACHISHASLWLLGQLYYTSNNYTHLALTSDDKIERNVFVSASIVPSFSHLYSRTIQKETSWKLTEKKLSPSLWVPFLF